MNGLPVGRERIGLKKIDIASGTFGSIFYGVKIEEGKNDILVVCREYGGKRNTCVRHVYLAGQPADHHARARARHPARRRQDGGRARLSRERRERAARPRRHIRHGERSGRSLAGLDVNPQQPGVQAVTANGRVVIALPPTRDSRKERIGVALNGVSAAARAAYEAPLRNWFLFGYGEGELGYSDLSGTGSTDRLIEKQHDGAFAEGKLSFYGQGEIRDGHLLTCAVDTRPLRDDMLFRRIEPEKYYPIYGDASELRFNAASRSGTFLRLDHRRYDAMLGDFRTDLGEGRVHEVPPLLQRRFGRGAFRAGKREGVRHEGRPGDVPGGDPRRGDERLLFSQALSARREQREDPRRGAGPVPARADRPRRLQAVGARLRHQLYGREHPLQGERSRLRRGSQSRDDRRELRMPRLRRTQLHLRPAKRDGDQRTASSSGRPRCSRRRAWRITRFSGSTSRDGFAKTCESRASSRAARNSSSAAETRSAFSSEGRRPAPFGGAPIIARSTRTSSTPRSRAGRPSSEASRSAATSHGS